ncbi:MAG: inositol phosphorylceramide synthase [Gemmatimonadetes bacterium]|nr:phosphatase PAP2 family protein [Gemmatimonadota bacterium]NNM05443.1 inositol phosphorylceramide synthase [Gemmatimonadota bacterium]
MVLIGMVLIQSSWFFTAMCLMAGAAFWAAAAGSRRDWLIWIGMLVGFALFADLRARMGHLVNPDPYYLYVIQMETLGGLIGVPTTWLQAQLKDVFLNRWGVLDAVMTAVYISFFITPQVVVVYLWRKGGPFPRYVAAACLLFAGALVVHFILPTAPPWMASNEGLIPGMERLGIQVLMATSPTLTEGGYAASANDVAAMPSVHQGLTVLAMIAMASHNPKTRWTAWIYGVTMLLAITYLGEHYAVDGIVGAGMAWGAWVVAGGRKWPGR